jgi:short-subunit dehydrogenase
MSNNRLANKVVMITGASRGLGAEIGCTAARREARVVLCARSKDALEAVAERIAAEGGSARTCVVDVTDAKAVRAGCDEISAAWGPVDVLVNAAGAKHEGAVVDTTIADARHVMDVNYFGALHCCQTVLPSMLDRQSGHIVNVSSVLGKRATPQRGPYSASKAALNALTDALRVELLRTGIHVTLVCPGRLADASETNTSDTVAGNADAKRFAMSTTTAAKRIVRCLQNPKRELILTASGRVLSTLSFVCPGLVDRILAESR